MTGPRALLVRRTPAGTAAAPATLQRSCACGETGESCPRCAAKRAPLQRLAGSGGPPRALPGAVSAVLRTSGQPLPSPISRADGGAVRA
ncbi:hypothetical protein WOB59_01165 [Methylocystis sp. IM4]|uniref:hypothetical protein n=1 Tax=Methylocystis sp. IM4 TaxID=3136560 RepID=UPI0031199761